MIIRKSLVFNLIHLLSQKVVADVLDAVGVDVLNVKISSDRFQYKETNIKIIKNLK